MLDFCFSSFSFCILSSKLRSLWVRPRILFVMISWNFRMSSQNFSQYLPLDLSRMLLLTLHSPLTENGSSSECTPEAKLSSLYPISMTTKKTCWMTTCMIVTTHWNRTAREMRIVTSRTWPNHLNPRPPFCNIGSFLFTSAISVKYLSAQPFSFIDIMKGNV